MMNAEELRAEIWVLGLWFENEYTKDEQKFRRLSTMGRLCDDGSDPNAKLIALYEEAEENRAKIKQYEKMLKEIEDE